MNLNNKYDENAGFLMISKPMIGQFVFLLVWTCLYILFRLQMWVIGHTIFVLGYVATFDIYRVSQKKCPFGRNFRALGFLEKLFKP